MIRISSGKYRSRIILTPEEGTLPTKNRVREAMMSMVQLYLPNANVLDLFAGSGALGIEALSRGARRAVFVDASATACSLIEKNLASLKEKNGTVVYASYEKAILHQREPFDLVLIDPPYAMKDAYQKAVDLLLERGLLAKECAVVLEYEGDLPFEAKDFSSVRDYTYGKTKVLLLRR